MPANYLPAKSGRRHWLRWLPHCTLELDVGLGQKADICAAKNGHVRFTPKSGHVRCSSRCPLWVKSGHMRCNKPCPLYPESGHQPAALPFPLSANSGHLRVRLSPKEKPRHMAGATARILPLTKRSPHDYSHTRTLGRTQTPRQSSQYGRPRVQ
jgi:hypothetical protein